MCCGAARSNVTSLRPSVQSNTPTVQTCAPRRQPNALPHRRALPLSAGALLHRRGPARAQGQAARAALTSEAARPLPGELGSSSVGRKVLGRTRDVLHVRCRVRTNPDAYCLLTNRLPLPGALLEVHRRHLLERQRDDMGGGLARRPRAHHTLAGRAAALHPIFHASSGLTIPTIPRATPQAYPCHDQL